MRTLLLFAVLAITVSSLGGCAAREQAAGHLYERDVPNIQYTPPRAGGLQGKD